MCSSKQCHYSTYSCQAPCKVGISGQQPQRPLQGRVPKTKYSALDHKKYVLPSRPQLLRGAGGEGKLQHPQIPGLKEAFKVNPLGCIQIRFTRLHLNTTGTADMMACQPDSSPKTFQFLNVSKCSHNTRALFLFIINTYCLCIQF